MINGHDAGRAMWARARLARHPRHARAATPRAVNKRAPRVFGELKDLRAHEVDREDAFKVVAAVSRYECGKKDRERSE